MPATRTKRPRTKRPIDKDHVPRPPNSFMLFRSYLKFNNLRPSPDFPGSFSNWTGYYWRTRPKEQKDAFARLAEEAKQEHMKRYPDYVFRPQPKGLNKDKERATTPKKMQGKGKGKGRASSGSSSRSIEDAPPLTTLPFPLNSTFNSSASQLPLVDGVTSGQVANLFFSDIGSVAPPVVSDYTASSTSGSLLNSFEDTFDVEEYHDTGSAARPFGSDYTASSTSGSPLNSFEDTFDVEEYHGVDATQVQLSSGIPAPVVNLDFQDADILNLVAWAAEQAELDNGFDLSRASNGEIPWAFDLEDIPADLDFDNNIQYRYEWNQQTPGAGPSSLETVADVYGAQTFGANLFDGLSFDSPVDFNLF